MAIIRSLVARSDPGVYVYHQQALLGLLSKQKVARNGLLFGLGEGHRVVGFENDEFEVNLLPHEGKSLNGLGHFSRD